MELLKNTPIEVHHINERKVYVKREDLCGVEGSPTFSKIRGIVNHLISLKEKGINIVGYTETSISMAGWGIAWACSQLNMKAVIFDPQYKETPELLQYHREQWKKFNAVVIPIPAGMAKVNYYINKNKLYQRYGKKAILLPLGLPFQETINETANQIQEVLQYHYPDYIIVNVGSGTILSGIWKGLENFPLLLKNKPTLIGVLGRTSNLDKKRQIIAKKAEILDSGLFNSSIELKLIDPGWQYTEKSEIKCPFPCHPYYDLKAWEWLVKNINKLPGEILFWNIGH